MQAGNATLPAAPRIALAHDWLVGMRGGERVLDRLARLFGPTDLYTLVSDGQPLTPAISRCRIITSPLQKFPGAAGRLRRHYLPLMPWAVERLRVRPCDLVLSTSSAVMKSIIAPPGVPHVCYCHSPPRYIWEQGGDYRAGEGGLARTVGLGLTRRWLAAWDCRTAARVTTFLANSRHTAARMKRCYGRDAEVVYPPVRTEFFTIDEGVAREDWLLVVAALEPYKRTDLVIQAANRARFRLKIAGDGSQRRRLRSMAGPGVELLGRVDDLVLRDLYHRAAALIFPQVEDFGIVAAEAQACGCPVVALARGGGLDIVTADSGCFFHAQTAEAIAAAVQQVRHRVIDPRACRSSALRFAEENFDRAVLRIVSDACAANERGRGQLASPCTIA